MNDEDELAWLDLALLRTVPENQCLEEADGLLTALAAGPVRATPGEYLSEILRASGEMSGFDSPEHKRQVIELLERRYASVARDLANDVAPSAWVYDAGFDIRGLLWARGYLHAMSLHKDAWEPLARDPRLVDKLVMPLLALLPDDEGRAGGALSYERRSSLVKMLPDIALATKAHWTGSWHPLLSAPMQRIPKIGRNDPCPCGSEKKLQALLRSSLAPAAGHACIRCFSCMANDATSVTGKPHTLRRQTNAAAPSLPDHLPEAG